MASRMFDAIGGGRQQGQQPRGPMPQEAVRQMQGDFSAWMAEQDRRADPEQLMQDGIRQGRYTDQQVRMARQMAARFGGLFGRR